MSKASVVLCEIAQILWPNGDGDGRHTRSEYVVNDIEQVLIDSDFGPQFAEGEPTPSLDCEMTEEGASRFGATVADTWPIDVQMSLMGTLFARWARDRRPIYAGEDNGVPYTGAQLRIEMVKRMAYHFMAHALREGVPAAAAARSDMRNAIEDGTAMACEHDVFSMRAKGE